MNYFNKFKNIRIFLLVHCLAIACGDTSIEQQDSSELQIALVADFKPSPSLAFNPPQPNFIDSEFSDGMNQILARMLSFKPKKIFVESIPGSRDCVDLNKSFRSYVFNQGLIHSYPNDVTHQVGFRLAYELGHHKLYCVDANRKAQEQQDQEAMLLLDPDDFADINKDFKRIERQIVSYLEDGEAAEAFEFLNEADQLRELQELRMRLYQSDESAAANSWQERKHKIIENLKQETSEDDDSILVLFNPMHLWDLRHDIESNSLDTKVLFFKDL